MDGARDAAMTPTNHFSKLVVWQLADQLRAEVLKLTRVQAFARDLKLRSQTKDAAHSVCRNIAEGFGGTHKEFARFLKIARRSLNEVQDTMHGALVSGYVQPADLAAARSLLARIYPALSRLLLYLDTTPDPAVRRDPALTRSEAAQQTRLPHPPGPRGNRAVRRRADRPSGTAQRSQRPQPPANPSPSRGAADKRNGNEGE